MNIGSIKTLTWLVSLGLAGGLVYRGYEYQQSEGTSYWDAEFAKLVLESAKKVDPPKSRGMDYDTVKAAVRDFDWTGKPPPPEPVDDGGNDEPVEIPKTPVADILSILMIQYDGEDPGGSRCLVRYKEKTGSDQFDWLGPGDSLSAPNPDGVVVHRIRIEDVEFTFEDEAREPERLAPATDWEDGLIVSVDEDGVRRPQQRLIPQVSQAPREAPTQTRLVARNTYRLGTEDVRTFNEDYTRILTEEVSTSTHFENGRRAGIRVDRVQAGSIAARHGAQEGDVIISINGHPVSSKQEAIKFVKNNAENYTAWEVVVENLGRRRTVIYRNPE